MTSKRRKITYIGAGVATLTLVGGVGTAVGVAATHSMADEEWQQGASVAASGWDHDADPAIIGTIQVPAETERLNDQAEDEALQALATITPEAAQQAATRAITGTPSAAWVDEEDGWLVYEVYVIDAQGTMTEVTVDAGNGEVLATDVEDRDDLPAQGVPSAPNAR